MSVNFKGIDLWNVLPKSIKNSVSLELFKKCVRKHLFSVQSRVRFVRDHALIFKITHSEKSSAFFSRTHFSKSRTEFEAVRFLT